MFFSVCCRSKINTTILKLKPFNSLLMEYINICNSNSNDSMYTPTSRVSYRPTGQPVSISKLAVTGLVSLPNLKLTFTKYPAIHTDYS